ncbi:hypothetical protein AD940_02420 [Gluconobacter thailandicus]|nr:hypothetical protein AD940_02420 [Gluconobacter thailandicus]
MPAATDTPFVFHVSTTESEEDLNLRLQSLLLSVCTQGTIQNSDDSSSVEDGLEIRRTFLEHRIRQLTLRLRVPDERQFLSFINPFGGSTGEQIEKNVDDIDTFPQQACPGPYTTATCIHRFKSEQLLWTLEHELSALMRKLGPIPRYGFGEYRHYRQKILSQGVSYIGRALHIAARQARHHPEIPLNWERCISLSVPQRGRDLTSVLLEPDIRVNQGDATERKRAVSVATFKKWKARYAPVIHILAAMDVLYSRAHLPPRNPGAWESSETRASLSPRSGYSFMDNPHDVTLTRATLSYALWFQKWATHQSGSSPGTPLLNSKNLVRLEGDIAFPEIVDHPVVRRWEENCLVSETVLHGDPYRLPEDFVRSALPGIAIPPKCIRSPTLTFPYDITLSDDERAEWRSSSPVSLEDELKLPADETIPLKTGRSFPDPADGKETPSPFHRLQMILPALPEEILRRLSSYRPPYKA